MYEPLDEASESGGAVKVEAPQRQQRDRSAAPMRERQPVSAVRRAPAPAMDPSLEDEDSFFAKHRLTLIIAGSGVLLAAGLYSLKPGGSSAPAQAPERIVSIHLPPMPPPPPPPKVQPPPPKEQKMETQAPVAQEEKHEEAPKPKAEAPLQTLGTGIKGDGPGIAGLGASGNGGGFGGSRPASGGSKWGWYAGKVQTRVTEALRGNKTTKSASLKIQVRIWPDSTGRIRQAKIDGTTGDRSIDNALQNEVLAGLQLEPPPPGMPMPIVMRLTARRP